MAPALSPVMLPEILLIGFTPSAYSYLNFPGLTFFSMLSKNVDQELVRKEETSFFGERLPHLGQVTWA
jgi:hypothetical protein